MSIDPRLGKKAVINSKNSRVNKSPVVTTLEMAFDLFYSAKRSEGLRERTLSDYRNYWRYFNEWLAKFSYEITDVTQINAELLREYLGYMTHDHKRYEDVEDRQKDGKPLSIATVTSRLRALQTMCKFWADEDIVNENAAARVKAPRHDTEDKTVFTDAQLDALLAAPDTGSYVGIRDRTAMLTLADTGLRVNELLSLETPYIDFSARCIRLPAALNKNRKPRIIPLSPAVLRELLRLIQETSAHFETSFVFVSNYGEQLKADHFRKQLRKYATMAGIDTKETRISPHRFRDYFCTNYLVNGGDLFTLQRIVSHADVKTTQGYVRPNEGAIRDNHAQYSPVSRLSNKRRK
ncbi:tyrosine-type recombinase/integrase [Paenibacillus sp. FSL L8-0436]|uniref:tyrosine-type recombinase/integrase n=1 Tax=Paenibacillus sp. FSL L8-0436 TaxID=2954686 RepID=UPI003158F60F